MSPNRRKLTDRYLEGIRPTDGERVVIADELRPGLALRVGSRKASWVFEKRVKGGVKRKHTLGAYCGWTAKGQRTGIIVSLADARKMALEIELESTRGVDRVERVREETERAQRAAKDRIALRDVLETYAMLQLANLKTGQERMRELQKALSPHLDAPATDLTKQQLQTLIDERAAAGRMVYANRLRAYLRAFTRWAHRRDYLPSDVGFDLDGAGVERPRDRVLSLEEIRTIFAVTHEMGELWGPLIRLLLLTGQRRGEITTLRWSEVDLDARQIRLEGARTKNGKPHITHLSEPAIHELVALRADAKNELVFTTTGITPTSGLSRAKKRLDRLLGDDFKPWRFHDFRRAMATALAQAGVPEGVVDRIQNHSASGSAPSAVARVYQQADLLPQRAAALDRWAEMVRDEQALVIKLSGGN